MPLNILHSIVTEQIFYNKKMITDHRILFNFDLISLIFGGLSLTRSLSLFQMTVLMTVCFMISWTPYAILAFYYIVHDYFDVPSSLSAGKYTLLNINKTAFQLQVYLKDQYNNKMFKIT